MSEKNSSPAGEIRRERVFRLLLLCAAAFAVLVYGATLGYAFVSNQRVETVKASIVTTRKTDAAEFNSLLTSSEKLKAQVLRSGQTPAASLPAAKPEAGTAGATGATGAVGPAGTSIVGAECTGSGLVLFFSDGTDPNVGQCVGATGKTGATGAVGPSGVSGPPGASSTVPGPSGDPGPAGPAGASGPAGPAGPAGATGNGLVDNGITCVTETDGITAYRFTYTDGTTQDVAGSCTPTPTEGTTP